MALTIGTVILTLNVFSVPVHASSILKEIGSVESSEDFAEDTNYSVLRGNHLNLGTVKIQKISSNEIAIHGVTQCHHVCD